MSPPQYQKITNGTLALSIVDPAAVGYSPDWQTPGGKAIDVVTAADYTDGPTGDSYQCQATDAHVSASSNTTTEDVPDGWCGPGTSTTSVKGSSFALNLSFVQDGHLPGGLTEFAYEHDAEEAYFLVTGNAGLPKLAGRCWVIAGNVLGPANTINSSDVVWSCDAKPLALWPTAAPLAATAAAPDADAA